MEFMIWGTVSSQSCFCWLDRAFPSLAAKNIINLILLLTIWWLSMCRVFSCVVGNGKTLLCYWENSVSLCLLYFVLQVQTYLLLQVSLDFLLLHSSPLWWKGHLFLVLILEGLAGLHRTVQLHLLWHYWWGYRLGFYFLNSSPILSYKRSWNPDPQKMVILRHLSTIFLCQLAFWIKSYSLSQYLVAELTGLSCCKQTKLGIGNKYIDFVGKVISLLFNSCSRFVIAFLPRSKASFNFMTAVTICSDFGAQENNIRHCLYFSPFYLPWSDETRCHDLSFLNAEF